MVTFMYWMMVVGGLVALAGGIAMLVFGEQMRTRDAAAGRVGPDYPTAEKQRRLAWIFVVIGVAAVALAFVF